ncbi:MAG: M48 family metalloprotease [Phycisphaerae bacterium]|nr:M48 family metalloprotease [Phycisphaerae bacterium]
MQLIVLILVAVVLLEDRSPSAAAVWPWASLCAAALPMAVPLGLQAILTRRALRMLDDRDARGVITFDRAEMFARFVPWFALAALAVAVFGFGWLETVRRIIGDLPAIDEMVALTPAFAAMAISWSLQAPMERRVREASLIRRLDEGLPVAPWPAAWKFVVARVRTNILLILVPVMIVLAVSELLEPLMRSAWPAWWNAGGRELTTLAIGATVYVVSPWIARLVLDVRPLASGTLRDDLLAVCAGCGVRVRDVLLWRTEYGMVNGAVMGLIAPLRFVMLTDGLLELLPREELRAVMAHEIGHVRRRHLPWMLGVLLVLLAVSSIAMELPLRAVYERLVDSSLDAATFQTAVDWLDRSAAIGAGAVALIAFGWVSRRFERQADAFAVQYLSREAGGSDITPGAVMAMTAALANVARHAGVPSGQFSWRHGSIRWRQQYLAALVGQRIDRLGIDRLIASLKLTAACSLVVLGALLAWELAHADEAEARVAASTAHARTVR